MYLELSDRKTGKTERLLTDLYAHIYFIKDTISAPSDYKLVLITCDDGLRQAVETLGLTKQPCFLLVFNPEDTEATNQSITYWLEGDGEPVDFEKTRFYVDEFDQSEYFKSSLDYWLNYNCELIKYGFFSSTINDNNSIAFDMIMLNNNAFDSYTINTMEVGQ